MHVKKKKKNSLILPIFKRLRVSYLVPIEKKKKKGAARKKRKREKDPWKFAVSTQYLRRIVTSVRIRSGRFAEAAAADPLISVSKSAGYRRAWQRTSVRNDDRDACLDLPITNSQSRGTKSAPITTRTIHLRQTRLYVRA